MGAARAADAYVIETGDGAAGIAVSEAKGFRFFASRQPFFRLEKQVFRSLRALRAALDGVAATFGDPAHAPVPRRAPSRRIR
jgi:hypothetical protein